jgi:signal transduction histidine kinase
MKLRVDLANRVPGVPSSVAQDLVEVSGEIQRLDRLVTDLLALTGRRLGKRVATDLRTVVEKRVDLLAPWANEQSVKLAVDGAGEADIDADALGRAVDNLLRNAVQFSPRDATVRATVEVEGNEARIVVGDRGAGVPADQVSKLFEPFFTTRAEGTGLGLALSRSIAHAHGGALEYSRHGDETRFVITIPRHAPASANGNSPT